MVVTLYLPRMYLVNTEYKLSTSLKYVPGTYPVTISCMAFGGYVPGTRYVHDIIVYIPGTYCVSTCCIHLDIFLVRMCTYEVVTS